MSPSPPRPTIPEAAPKLADDGPELSDSGQEAPTGVRRSFNEAAHKLGYWPVRPAPRPRTTARLRPCGQQATMSATSSRTRPGRCWRSAPSGSSTATSARARYTPSRPSLMPPRRRARDAVGVYGIVSLIFWALMIVVSTKYAGFIMRAHNRGDGGIMALTAVIKRRKVVQGALLVTLGIFGAGLFFGDGMITPAISVISAVEGLNRPPPACRTSWCRSRSGSWSRCSRFSATALVRSGGCSVR